MLDYTLFEDEIAVKYGVDEAILIGRFALWLRDTNKAEEDENGTPWVCISLRRIAKWLPYWSKDKVSRLLGKLTDAGLVLKKAVEDGQGFRYTLASVVMERSQNETHGLRMRQEGSQVETGSIPYYNENNNDKNKEEEEQSEVGSSKETSQEAEVTGKRKKAQKRPRPLFGGTAKSNSYDDPDPRCEMYLYPQSIQTLFEQWYHIFEEKIGRPPFPTQLRAMWAKMKKLSMRPEHPNVVDLEHLQAILEQMVQKGWAKVVDVEWTQTSRDTGGKPTGKLDLSDEEF